MQNIIKLCFTLICLSACVFLYGQKISKIDFDEIQQKIADSQSPFFYPSLIERFCNYDTTLTLQELNCIYYGNVYYDKYNPYGTTENEKQFMDLFRAKKYSEATVYGQKEIEDNPVNTSTLYKMIICYHELGDRANAYKYAFMYYSLLNVIYQSGNGKSRKTAYVVIKVNDEYAILGDLELRRLNQRLSGDTDILTIDKTGQQRIKGQKKIKALYFNVRKPLEFMIAQFGSSETDD
jgi:hypothetical protein